MDSLQPLVDGLIAHRQLIIAIVAVLFAVVLVRRISDTIRQRMKKDAPLNPKLHKYAGRSETDLEADRKAAASVIATSSTGLIAGYDIVRQIDAVFVEGHRTPEEAVSALKSVAGSRGANAIINLSQQRTAAGRCTAQGDAVAVLPLNQNLPPTNP